MANSISETSARDPAAREVRYEHSTGFPGLLTQLGISLLVSTYQAGKLALIHAAQDKLVLKFYNFEQPMGVAVHPRRIAVGSKRQVWFLSNAADIAPRIEPAGSHDACFVARSCHVTGEIHGHEMSWSGDELWVVNTLFSCLCTLRGEYSFVPRWKPPFVTSLAAEDRCHLNGLAMVSGQPRYVTVLGRSDIAGGWRANKVAGGCLIDVPSGETMLGGLCMPHSPRVHEGRLWLLDSGKGHVVQIETGTNCTMTVAALPGYTRGVAFFGPYAFVGLSKVRETSTFGGVPIAERRQDLKCGVWVIDWRQGRTLLFLEFQAGVDEIFDVQVLPGIRAPVIGGPFPDADGASTIWIVPAAIS